MCRILDIMTLELYHYAEKKLSKLGQVIKTFPDGSFLEYDRGSFDDWCVYLTNISGNRRPPRDTDYFSQLKSFAEQFGVEKVYGDYVKVYNMTGKQADSGVLHSISFLAKSYGTNALQADRLFSVLYMAMIAEERKAGTRLGKRIKRLGVHKLLIENNSVGDSANFMRGMGWRDIARLCEERGF